MTIHSSTLNSISVLIPNYNHARYLPFCLDSFLNQTLLPREIVIVDDASTDESVEVIQAYQAKYPQIVFLQNHKNQGIHETFNRGLQCVSSSFVVPSAADDFVFPYFLEEALLLFLQEPHLAIVCGDSSFFERENVSCLIHKSIYPAHSPLILSPEEFVNRSKRDLFYIMSNACMYKKEILLQYKGYLKELASFSDYWLNVQIALKHPIGYIPKPFSAMRMTNNSYSQVVRRNLKQRFSALKTILVQVFQSEDKLLQDRFVRSAILSCTGYFMLLSLIMMPVYWTLFPRLAWQVIRRKWRGQ